MESTFNVAYNVLPSLSRDELMRLQSRITALLLDKEDIPANLLHPRSEAEWEAEFDAAISDFDAGNGYEAEQMIQSLRERFGWGQA